MNSIIDKILSTETSNGARFWARHDGDIHAPAGFSTIDVLGTLGLLGAKATDDIRIQQAIDFIFSYFQDDGQFRYSPTSAKLPCITARILTALGRLGFSDERMEMSYTNLLKTQSEDGGWRCATVRLGKSPETDASNPGTTLYVLDAFLYRKKSIQESIQLDSGVSFLLNHWDYRKPLGPCEFGIGTTFMKTEFPLLRYNLLYYCYVLSNYRTARTDTRFLDATSLLRSKYREGGIINENPHKRWQDYKFARKGEICKPALSLVEDYLFTEASGKNADSPTASSFVAY